MPTLNIIWSEIGKDKKEGGRFEEKKSHCVYQQNSHEYLDIGLSHKDGN